MQADLDVLEKQMKQKLQDHERHVSTQLAEIRYVRHEVTLCGNPLLTVLIGVLFNSKQKSKK